MTRLSDLLTAAQEAPADAAFAKRVDAEVRAAETSARRRRLFASLTAIVIAAIVGSLLLMGLERVMPATGGPVPGLFDVVVIWLTSGLVGGGVLLVLAAVLSRLAGRP